MQTPQEDMIKDLTEENKKLKEAIRNIKDELTSWYNATDNYTDDNDFIKGECEAYSSCILLVNEYTEGLV